MPDDDTRGLWRTLMSGIIAVIIGLLAVAMGWLAVNIIRDDGADAAATVGFKPGDFRAQERLSTDYRELEPIKIPAFGAESSTEIQPDGSEMHMSATVLRNLQPAALMASPDGKFYVATTEGLLVIFDITGKWLRSCALFEGSEPTCLAAGEDGTVYVGYAGAIETVTPQGERKAFAKFANPKTRLTSLAVNDQTLFAADAGTRVIHCLALADGKETMKIGGQSIMQADSPPVNESERGADVPSAKTRGQDARAPVDTQRERGAGVPPARIDGDQQHEFIIPSPYFDVAIGTDGSLWAANTGRHALENFAADGTLRSSWQRLGLDVAGFCGCCNPIHFAILPDGSFLTAERGVPRVKISGPEGDFRELVAGPDQFVDGAIPGDVAALPDGRVLVLDQARKQVRVFGKK